MKKKKSQYKKADGHIEVIDDRLYYKKDLLTFLNQEGFPATYPTLLKYERMGLIISPRRTLNQFMVDWRVYTGLEMKQIVQKLKVAFGK